MSPSARNSLPSEITETILRLLPVKSLCRFNSVSKTWNSLISDPQFIKTHLHHHMDHHHQTRKLIMVSDTRSLYSVGVNELLPYLNSDYIPATAKQLNFPLHLTSRTIFGSCNGLVLAEHDNYALLLLNPTTLEYWNVPSSPFTPPDEEFEVRYGFGYDSSSDDYKVVLLLFWDTYSFPDLANTDTAVAVYSMRSNSWRKLPDSPYTYFSFNGALINQSFHWIESSSMIVAFSLADETFNEINLPDSFQNEEVRIYEVVNIGGKLGVVLIVEVGYELWVMGEYGVGNSWIRFFSHEYVEYVRPVCLVEGSDRDVVLECRSRVCVYNVDESRRRDVRISGGPDYFFIGGAYIESLESPARFITPP